MVKCSALRIDIDKPQKVSRGALAVIGDSYGELAAFPAQLPKFAIDTPNFGSIGAHMVSEIA